MMADGNERSTASLIATDSAWMAKWRLRPSIGRTDGRS